MMEYSRALTSESADLPVLAAKIPLRADEFHEAREIQPERHALAVVETKTQLELNRENGHLREEVAHENLKREYPATEGYIILRECVLRDEAGEVVRDPAPPSSVEGGLRRLDFVVVKDGVVVDAVEVTSLTAVKDQQMEKENRIREGGGNWIKDRATGNLYEIPDHVVTRVVRYA